LTQQRTVAKVIPRKYSEIQEGLKSSDKKVKFVMYLFSDGPKEYDFLLKLLSMGRDQYWRNEIIRRSLLSDSSLESARKVLDIASGTGLLTFDFVRRAGASVVAVDVTREMLVRALELRKSKGHPAGLVEFIQARAENLPLRSGMFDCATISLATRNVTNVRAMFDEMTRCVNEYGLVVSMDFTKPKGRLFAPFYRFYTFELLPALGLVISRHWNGIFSYLASSIQRSKSPEEIKKIMEDSRLTEIEIKRMTHGVTALVSGVKKSN
jgi:demethylmenaquinone methyltransferase / 2-methoxy-6-polyprenyl-1,4-benzoquinol methylase